MDQKGIEQIKLMFNEGESICVSHNKYGYHSIPRDSAFGETVTLVSPDSTRAHEEVSTDLLSLVALNPIQGFRADANCRAFRSFLLEMDGYDLKQQISYLRKLGIPYSALIFSGGKSIHTLITLDKDLPDEKTWRLYAEWILNRAALCDQATKNPSRSVRIAGALRDGTHRQHPVEIKGRVDREELTKYLLQYPHLMPRPKEKRPISTEPHLDLLPEWVQEQLKHGIDFGHSRNVTWFNLACCFARVGYSEDRTIDFLSKYFVEDRTFKEKEWLTSIASAFKTVHNS
jgi:hypothetical protein